MGEGISKTLRESGPEPAGHCVAAAPGVKKLSDFFERQYILLSYPATGAAALFDNEHGLLFYRNYEKVLSAHVASWQEEYGASGYPRYTEVVFSAFLPGTFGRNDKVTFTEILWAGDSAREAALILASTPVLHSHVKNFIYHQL